MNLPQVIGLPLCIGLQSLFIPALFKARLKHIRTNIKLCFPQLSEKEQLKIEKDFSKKLMQAYYDYVRQYDRLYNRDIPYTISGLEHLQEALSQNKGVILLGGHFTSIFLAPFFIQKTCGMRFTNMYQEMHNPFFSKKYMKSQNKYFNSIAKTNIRQLLKSLANNEAVFYFTDLNDRSGKTFAPFFGIPAATNTAISRIAKISGCKVIPFSGFRLPKNKGYEITLYPPLKNFPSDDATQDVTRTNKIIEDFVRQHPEQYLWLHRRFKKRPPGEPKIY